MSSLNGEGKRKEREGEKKQCQYGAACYRRNPYHLQEFSHPDDPAPLHKKHKPETGAANNNSVSNNAKKLKSETSVINGSGRGGCVEVCGLLYTTVSGINEKYNRPNMATDLTSLLTDSDDNKLVESVHFNYMFDVGWLVSKYPTQTRAKPLLLVHGFQGKEKVSLEGECMKHSHIQLVHAKLPIPFGTHHTKMVFLLYSDGLKVVVHTANLIPQDWKQKTQGLWVSPMFKRKKPSYGEENDVFKKDLVEYLDAYKSTKLNEWISKINEFDMCIAKVRLIASVPGRHVSEREMKKWGHLKLRHVLSQHGPDSTAVTKDWSVVGQFSSIGSLGEDSTKWLTSEWLHSLSTCKRAANCGSVGKSQLSLIYPTIRNVRSCLEGYSAGGSLPYGVQLAMKQRYLKPHLCAWVSNKIGRSLASPHIKSYTRLSPDCTKAAWYLLTSSNLSKAAWGVYEKNKTQLMIRSFEVGVLLLPNAQSFASSSSMFFDVEGEGSDSLKLPFDVPLTPYSETDKPWVWDIKYTEEDSHGKLWIPR